MSANTKHPTITGRSSARDRKRVLNRGCWLALGLLVSTLAHAQEIEKPQPADGIHHALISKPLGLAREVAATGRDFAAFRDPQWSILTIGQISASAADGVTSLNNIHSSSGFEEKGMSRFFVGRRPDAHKYIIAGIVEIGVEAVAAHYFRSHEPARKWYWRGLWLMPQSLSLYEHTRAARHNAEIGPE
jgi:hypothetical protein